MKKVYKIGFITTFTIILFYISILYFGLILMNEKDFHIDLSDLKTELQDGDIIFHTSKSIQSKAIQLATKSKYSHMGMIYKKNGVTYVYEAVQPVKLTQIDNWIKRGEKGHYVVKRLKESVGILTPNIKLKMKEIGNEYIGKDYDIYFEWTDEKIYCSELIWKIYKRATKIEIGKLETLKDFDLSNKLVKQKMIERYGNKIQLDEIVISPARIYNSDKLTTVYSE